MAPFLITCGAVAYTVVIAAAAIWAYQTIVPAKKHSDIQMARGRHLMEKAAMSTPDEATLYGPLFPLQKQTTQQPTAKRSKQNSTFLN